MEALYALELSLSALPASVTNVSQFTPQWPLAGAPGPVAWVAFSYDPTFPLLCVAAYLTGKVHLDPPLPEPARSPASRCQ